jgi:hypothetical protein
MPVIKLNVCLLSVTQQEIPFTVYSPLERELHSGTPVSALIFVSEHEFVPDAVRDDNIHLRTSNAGREWGMRFEVVQQRRYENLATAVSSEEQARSSAAYMQAQLRSMQKKPGAILAFHIRGQMPPADSLDIEEDEPWKR